MSLLAVVGAGLVCGAYDLTILGPNSFLRRFQGQVIRADQNDRGAPSMAAQITGGKNARLRLPLTNHGAVPVVFTLTGNDFTSHTQEGDRRAGQECRCRLAAGKG